MIHFLTRFVLPLMHHLVQECLNRLVPAVTTNVSRADHDFRPISLLSAKRIVTEPRFHPARNTNWNRAELTAELRQVQLAMRTREITNEALVCRMCSLNGTLLTRRQRRTTRIEIE